MYRLKKIISLLIVVTMILTIVGIGVVSASGKTDDIAQTSTGASTVTVFDAAGQPQEYVVEVGDEITFYSYLNVYDCTQDDPTTTKFNEQGTIVNIDARVQYDSSMLELKPVFDEDDDFLPDMFPQLNERGGISPNLNNPGVISFNASTVSSKGYNFKNNDCVLAKCVFDVIAEGNSYITLPIISLNARDFGNTSSTEATSVKFLRLVDQGEKLENFTKFETLIAPEHPTQPSTEESTGESTEESTTESTTESTAESTAESTTESTAESSSETEVETVTNTYIVVGQGDGMFALNWDANDTNNQMKKNENGTYSKTFYNVTPNDGSDKVKQIKVVEKQPDGKAFWYGNEAGKNIKFVVSKPCDVTVTIDPQTHEITVSGSEENAIKDWEIDINTMRVVGNGDPSSDGNWLNGISWETDNDANLMTEIEEGVYQIVFDNVPENMGYQFKFVANGTWVDDWGIDEEIAQNMVLGSETEADYNGSNITFDVDSASKVTLTLNLRDLSSTTGSGAKFTIDIKAVEAPTETQGTETQATETQATETQGTETQGTEPTEAPTKVTDETKSDDTQVVTQADTQKETGKSATPDAPTISNSSTNSNASNTNSATVRTGSVQLAVIFLVMLTLAAGIVVFAKKRKVD